VNEALASGLPCVVSDACGCAENVAELVGSSTSYPCGDVDALASALLATFASDRRPDLRPFNDRHSIRTTVESTRALYDSISSRRSCAADA
jgi:glycosyltransferase involved in cell wall biosynthesis